MVLHKYREASICKDRDAQVETVIKLLDLPAKVLKYEHLDRGRKRKFLIQKRLVEVIRENKNLEEESIEPDPEMHPKENTKNGEI